MGKGTIESFFKRKNAGNSEPVDGDSNLPIDPNHSNSESRPAKSPRIEITQNYDVNSLERDPGLRPQIWTYPVDKRDEVRRAYIKAGPYQFILSKYPKSKEKHARSFQASWFQLFPSWLEYSPSKDAAFCLPCFLFRPENGPSGIDAFTVNGFQSWKKVRNGKDCAFLAHIGKDAAYFHRNSARACEDLMHQYLHIAPRLERYTTHQIIENRLRLQASIDAARWLAVEGCAFRGHDETKDSLKSGKFKKLLNLMAAYNDKVAKVMNNAPKNGTYTSSRVQKEILSVLSTRVKNAIRDEIGDGKFCLVVDKARDVSKREQMSIVLRFVDKEGYL